MGPLGERFNNVFKKDLMIMQKGGIPIFKRREFLRKVEQNLNPEQYAEDP
jgi:hypothetical protein